MNGIFHNLISIEGQNFIESVNVLGHIGAGNSAVFLVEDVKSGETFAMKEIIIKDDLQYQQVKKEINLLNKLSGQNQNFVVKMLKYMICQQISKNEFHDDNHQIAYILMERGQTSLSKFIELQVSLGQYLSFAQILKVIHTTIQGFAYLQEQCIAHRDIKPENILLIDAQELQIKVCDVGSGQEQIENHDSTQTITGFLQIFTQGTLPFLAPEIIDCFDQRKVKVNAFKADVFSLGLCFLYLITFQKMTSRDRRELSSLVYKEIIKEWTKLAIQIVGKNQLIIRLLCQMLMFDVNTRLDFIQLNQELQKNVQEDINNLSKTLNFGIENKLQLKTFTLDQVQFSIKPQLSRQQSANKFKIYSQITSPDNIQKVSNTNTKKLKFLSIRNDDKLKSQLPQLNKEVLSLFQEVTPPAKLQLNPKIIHISANCQLNPNNNLFIIAKIQSNSDLLKMTNDSVVYGIWFDCQFQLDSQILINFLQSSSQMQTLYLRFGADLKISETTSKSYLSPQLRSLIFEIHSIDQNVWNLVLLILINSQDTLQYFELVIKIPQMSYQWLDPISQYLSQCKKLSSIQINIKASGINYEKIHKLFLQYLFKCAKVEELSIQLSKNNLLFVQPQWTFNEKLRILKLDYSENQIGKSLNSFSLSLTNLVFLQQLDINFASTETNQKDINFLIVQLTKLTNLLDLSLNFDQILCFNDTSVSFLLQSLSKLPKLSSLSLSLVGLNLASKTTYECLHFFEEINHRQIKTTRCEFSLRIDRTLSKNEIIKYSVNQKLLPQFKIDFLISNTNSLQVIYLKSREGGLNLSQKYPQVCNTGQNLLTSSMNICITCSDKYSCVLQRQVIICEQCTVSCHIKRNIIKSQSVSTQRAQLNTQRHNIIKYNYGAPCDCSALGKCKFIQPTHCSNKDEPSIFQMSVKLIIENDIICLWCRKYCHSSKKTQLLYPQRFKCSCKNDHSGFELQQV